MHPLLRAGLLLFGAVIVLADAPAWQATPWLADLAQFRAAIDRGYPNREWLTDERHVSLDRWFDSAANMIRRSGSDEGARKVLSGLSEQFGDGHLALTWPAPDGAQARIQHEEQIVAIPASTAAFCAARGYDARQVEAGTSAALPGYRKIEAGGLLPAGIVYVGGAKLGVLRIGLFAPNGYPALCEKAVAHAHVPIDKPCEDVCSDRITADTYKLLTQALMTTVRRLRRAGARTLLIDLTGNGGGSEWAEAAARIVSPVPLKSAPRRVLRDERWVRKWHDLATRLRNEAERAAQTDRAMLAGLAARADTLALGLTPCPGATCSRLGDAGFASGLLPELPAKRFAQRWVADVFSPAQFPYRDSVWTGPLIVLVDSETWSAAEQFTALLRDNDAAIVLGERTGGAGCGHLDGNHPITLSFSKGVLEMPNCARFRRAGSNEVGGIMPDIPTGARARDDAASAGRQTAAFLPRAVAKARAMPALHQHQTASSERRTAAAQ